jgi:hypothetical protein
MTLRCEGIRHDGAPCGATACRESVFCQYHENGTGRCLRAIEEDLDPHTLEEDSDDEPVSFDLFDDEEPETTTARYPCAEDPKGKS